MNYTLKDFSYDFPETLIATEPLTNRDQSRLLKVNRQAGELQHGMFSDILHILNPHDVLVLNNSKVFPCRLETTRTTGGRQEIFLVKCCQESTTPEGQTAIWDVLINANKKVPAGTVFEFPDLRVTMLGTPGESRQAKLSYSGNLFGILAKIASIPLPPYMHRAARSIDDEYYQTVYAKQTGSVAAPTAGLHFTSDLLSKIQAKGIQTAEVTLHVGPGTFLPVRVDRIEDHVMHEEHFSIDQKNCDIINNAKKSGGRIFAVGTTTTRVLETLGQSSQDLTPTQSSTRIFIHPPYNFKIIDGLITNFHQPESTLLMLVSAFAGYENIMQAYREAIRQGYKLFSYGDAMVIC